LNPRDRVLTTLEHAEPDRVPFYEHFVDNEIMEAMTGEPATKLVPIDLGTARASVLLNSRS